MCVKGTNYDETLTLVTEAGEELNDAYLFLTNSAQFGHVQAKLSSESTYRVVGIPFDANCFLGYITAEAETDVDFRLNFAIDTADGDLVIPVAVGHDDQAPLPNPGFNDDWPELWADDWEDQELWYDDWQ